MVLSWPPASINMPMFALSFHLPKTQDNERDEATDLAFFFGSIQ
jgi:hypothetical protein